MKSLGVDPNKYMMIDCETRLEAGVALRASGLSLAEAGQVRDPVGPRQGCLRGLIPLSEGRLEPGGHPAGEHGGGEKGLSERELALFRYFARHAGRIVTRDELLLNVWQLNPKAVVTRTVDMHVVHLRTKLEEDPKHPKLLITVRGAGYVFRGSKAAACTTDTEEEALGQVAIC